MGWIKDFLKGLDYILCRPSPYPLPRAEGGKRIPSPLVGEG